MLRSHFFRDAIAHLAAAWIRAANPTAATTRGNNVAPPPAESAAIAEKIHSMPNQNAAMIAREGTRSAKSRSNVTIRIGGERYAHDCSCSDVGRFDTRRCRF